MFCVSIDPESLITNTSQFSQLSTPILVNIFIWLSSWAVPVLRKARSGRRAPEWVPGQGSHVHEKPKHKLNEGFNCHNYYVVCADFFLARDSSPLQAWKRRFFVLKRMNFNYYKDEQSYQAGLDWRPCCSPDRGESQGWDQLVGLPVGGPRAGNAPLQPSVPGPDRH